MNIILNDSQREVYAPDIARLFELCPETMKRKIFRANVQQAYVLSTVEKLSAPESEMLCVGSYEDTACEALIKLRRKVTAIDPAINMNLDTFFKSAGEKRYDIIFSTSVIEHVPDDELFIRQICQLLCPNGCAVITCDFNDDYGKPGVSKPIEDYKLYTKNDLLVRFDKILKENSCEIWGDIDYDHAPDFHYNGSVYSFATYVFIKR